MDHGSDRLRRFFAPIAKVARWLGPLLGLGLIIGAVFVLQRQLDEYSYSDVVRQLQSTPLSSVALALLLTAGAYGILVGYDTLALAYVGHSPPLRKIALGSFVAYSMSHSLGFHMITSGSIRYRFWSSWGLPNADIARALGLASSSFLLGMLLISGVVLIFEPPHSLALLHLPTLPLRIVGALILGGLLWFFLWMKFTRPPFRLFGAEVMLPRVRFTMGHVLIAASDWLMAASVAYVLMPAGHGVGLLHFVGVFLFALLVAAIGHVPGGVGVFEVLVVAMMEPYVAPPAVLGSLILYRIVYYVIPFVLGLLCMVANEANIAHAAGRRARWIPGMMSIAFGTAVFTAGTILLLSGAVKMNADRMATVQTYLPLPLIEFAHFAASMLGAVLLVLAWFIQRRLDRAYKVVAITLLLAAIASLMRGLVWEAAALQAAVLAGLVASRKLFARPGTLRHEPLSTAWLTGVVTVLLLTVWLGIFSFKGAVYSADLWTEFAISSDISRFMRATAGAILFVLALALHRRSRLRAEDSEELELEPSRDG